MDENNLNDEINFNPKITSFNQFNNNEIVENLKVVPWAKSQTLKI